MNNHPKKFKRIFVLVTDSLGIGAAKDAYKYNDQDANTFKHLSYAKENFAIPTLNKLGIKHIVDANNCTLVSNPLASYGIMEELSIGKDTLTGHWEMMGLEVKTPFPSFTDNGFPPELIKKIEEDTGYKVLGNYASSGTEIIKQLGEAHLQEKSIIVYTSADSVLQIAANEQTVPVSELYKICEKVRKITLENKDWMVGRIIARPFIGQTKDTFQRTANRHDYAVSPFNKTVLDSLCENKYGVISVGKINDIFNAHGITEAHKIKNNDEGMDITTEIAKKEDFTGLCFVNLVDFDSLYGHRRDPIGYANCVEQFDRKLAALLPHINNNDLLIICADHGNDPIHSGTDHTRENVPLIVFNNNLQSVNLGTRKTFADIGATISENFNVTAPNIGKSFLKELKS